jgi:hypothetical protein
VPERTPFTTFTTTNFDLNLVWTAHKASCPGLCSGATIGTWFSVEHRLHSLERDTIFVYIWYPKRTLSNYPNCSHDDSPAFAHGKNKV